MSDMSDKEYQEKSPESQFKYLNDSDLFTLRGNQTSYPRRS